MTFTLLRIADLRLALAEDRITEVVDWKEPTPLPFAPQALVGVASISGRMFTVIDLVKVLQSPTTEPAATPRFIVALTGDEQLALAITSYNDDIQIVVTNIESMTAADGLIDGAFEHEGSQWQTLNADQLFNSLIQGKERRRRRT